VTVVPAFAKVTWYYNGKEMWFLANEGREARRGKGRRGEVRCITSTSLRDLSKLKCVEYVRLEEIVFSS
jgi:hypothetical protein